MDVVQHRQTAIRSRSHKKHGSTDPATVGGRSNEGMGWGGGCDCTLDTVLKKGLGFSNPIHLSFNMMKQQRERETVKRGGMFYLKSEELAFA